LKILSFKNNTKNQIELTANAFITLFKALPEEVHKEVRKKLLDIGKTLKPTKQKK